LFAETLCFSAEDGENFVTIAAFECRGVTPIAFEPRNEWTCQGTSDDGTEFEDIDLSEDWSDYDDKAEQSVSILSFESKFERE